MNNQEITALAAITDVVSGIPEPVRVSFSKAVSDLLGGLVQIPAAKLKQYAQAIEDTTAARSMTAGLLAKAAAEEARKDSDLLKVAAEIYLPTTLRKARNRLGVAQSAAEHLATAKIEDSGKESTPPDNDWMNVFMRFSEDASSERLQDLFGRILAGQVLRPHAFGLGTIRTLSELDQGIANDFIQAWSKSVGTAIDYSPEWQKGDGFARWKRLSDAGLMAPTNIVQYLPPFKPAINESALWSPFSADGISLLVYFKNGSASQWHHIEFTRIGREIGSILPKPNYKDNMRQAAHRLSPNGLTKIELLEDGKAAELIWQISS